MAAISPLAGKPAPPSILVNVTRLIRACYDRPPDSSLPADRILQAAERTVHNALQGRPDEDDPKAA